MKYGFGVDLGGTTVKIAFFDQEGTMKNKWEIPTRKEDGGCNILPDIAQSISQFLQTVSIPREDLLGIGIGIPGPVDPQGTVNRCVNLGWGVFNIPEVLGKLTGLPVKAGNDANVAALGESWKGGGAGCKNMIVATLGTGVGGGIIVEGRVLHGFHGAGGEIGHMTVNLEETVPCNCGRCGCVEQYCSATGVVRIAKQFLSASDAPSALRSIEPLTCKDVFDAANNGDKLAQEVLEKVYHYMGLFLANMCVVVDPEIIVLGGGVSKAGKPLLEGAQRYFRKYAMHACADTKFALASLGNDAGAYGAFKLAMDAFA